MDSSKFNWNVLYTKPQQEFKVLELLMKNGIEAYCPSFEEVRQWSDRKKKIKVPLIKSYVFVRIDNKDRLKVFEVSGVVRYLFWLGRPAVVQNFEIETLKNYLLEEYASIKLNSLENGARMVIKSGPFADHEGTVVKLNAKTITIQLEQLGLMVTMSK